MARPVRLVFLADDTQLRSALARMVGQTAATQASLKALERNGADLKRIGRAITVGVTLPVVAAATGAVVLAAKFDQTMTHIQTLAGASQTQISKWSQQLLALGPALGKSPQELADSLYYIVSSGAKASDALSILTASTKASAVGLGNTQDVANLVTSAMNSYGSSNLSASKATDILLRAVKDGKGEASDFASTIGSVVPIASQVGVSFDQVAAGMSAITLTGSSTSEAATQMRNIFTEILHPSAGVKKALDSIGLSAGDVQNELRQKGLLATLQDMKTRVGGNSAAFAKLFPNIRGLLGVLSLTGENGAKVASVFKDVAGAGGDVNTAFNTQKQTTMFKFKDALAALESAGIQLGNVLAPSFAKVAGWVAKMATALSKMDPHTRNTIIVIAGLVAALGPLLYVLGSTVKTFSQIARHPIITMIALLVIAFVTAYTQSAKFRTAVQDVVKALMDAGTWIKNNATLLESLGAGIGSFLAISKGFSAFKMYFGFLKLFGVSGVSLFKGFLSVGPMFGKALNGMKAAWAALNTEFLFSPLGIIIGLVVGLAIAFVIAYNRSAAFRNFVHTALHDIAAVAKVVWGALVTGAKAAWNWIGAKLTPVFHTLAQVCKTVFSAIMAVLRPTFPFFREVGVIVGESFRAAAGFVKKHWSTIKAILLTAVSIFIPMIGAVRLASAIWKKWGSDIVAVLKFVGAIWAGIFRIMAAVVTAIFKAVYAVASAFFKLLVTLFVIGLKVIWTMWKTIFTLLWTVLKMVVTGAYATWVSFWKLATAILTASWSIVKAILSVLVAYWTGAWNLMKTLASNAASAVKNLVTGNFTGLAGNIRNVWNGIVSFLRGIWNALPAGARSAAQAVFDGLMGVFNRIAGAVSGVFSSVANIIKSAINDEIRGINSIHLPSINIPGVGKVGGQSLHIPYLADGGMVNAPTLAMVGEAGPELVLPLTRKSRALELLAQSGLTSAPRPLASAVSSAGAAPGRATKTVHIENILVTTTAKSTTEIGKDVAWEVKRALL